jgi:diguanylate cyclase (GGDEF)-like protein/PAS domain S-box-containing protein
MTERPAGNVGGGWALDREELLIDLAKQRVLRDGDFLQAARVVAHAATAILGADRAGVWLFDATRSTITSKALFDDRDDGFIESASIARDQAPAYFAALENERAITANDVERDSRTSELWDRYWKPAGVVATLDAPIRVGDGIVGVICVERRDGSREWSSDDVHRAATIADLAAIAYEVAERRKAEVELATTALLQRTVTQISARFVSLTPEETEQAIEQALEQLGEAVGADGGFVLRYSEDLGTIADVIEWSARDNGKIKAVRGMATDAFQWWMTKVRERETIVVEDMLSPGFDAGAERKLAEMMDIRSLAAVPMVSGSRLIGLLSLASSKPRTWSDISVGLFRVCGEVVAGALERKRVEAALRDSERRFRHLFERNLAGVFRCTIDGRVIECNDACAKIFGFESPEELMAVSANAVYRDADVRRDLIARLEEHGTLWNVELPLRRRDGREIWVIENASIVAGADGTRYIEGAMFDATEMKRAQEAMLASEERYRLLFERNPAGVFRATGDGEIVDCNGACVRILGFDTQEELKKHTLVDLFVDPRELESDIEALREKGIIVNKEIELRRRDGSTIWVLANVVKRRDEAGRRFIEGGLVDITKRREAEALIEYQAYHDSLTGLPNRNLLKDRLQVALAGAKRNGSRVALLYLDLDEFKLVNDTLGHTVGDELLQRIAKRIENAIREDDTVARMGGDEFTVIASGIESDKAAVMVAEKLLEEVGQPLDLEGHLLFPTASIGIALFPADGADGEALLRQADIAMYRAKEAGRNNYQLATAEMNERAVARLTLERHLRVALERRELELYYQPQIDVVSGRITGVEALIRWNHPDQGLLSPAAFIPVAEETRLIVPIGEWVIREASLTARRLSDLGNASIRVSLNLSARFFRQSNLVNTIRGIIRSSGVDPSLMEFEITESVAMQSTDWTLDTLRKLKSLGVSLAIDDFGTGYSSLNYLKQFPIDRLKIDQSFVRDVDVSESDAAIVSAIIAMARSLRIETIAEGVEQESQRDFLLERGCREMQGFLFARPLPLKDLEALLGRKTN